MNFGTKSRGIGWSASTSKTTKSFSKRPSQRVVRWVTLLGSWPFFVISAHLYNISSSDNRSLNYICVRCFALASKVLWNRIWFQIILNNIGHTISKRNVMQSLDQCRTYHERNQYRFHIEYTVNSSAHHSKIGKIIQYASQWHGFGRDGQSVEPPN